MKGKIFICYRREDSQWMAGRLHDRLLKNFSKNQIFRDVDSILPGQNFETMIADYVGKSGIFLAVIGTKWLESLNAKSNAFDYVHFEISAALKNNIKVIPILLENTQMPSPESLPEDIKDLGKIQAFTISNQSFDADTETLVKDIKQNVGNNKIKVISIFLLSFSLALATYLFLHNAETSHVNNYLNIVRITSDAPISVIDISTGFAALIYKDQQPAFIPFPDYTTLCIFNEAEDGHEIFYYLLKSTSPTKINFRVTNNKLYSDNKLKAICINNDRPIDTLTGPEINELETITIATTQYSDSLFSYLKEIVQTNPHVSIISSGNGNFNYNYDSNTVKLMRLTIPEILFCKTSFNGLHQLNLGDVKCAAIVGDGSSNSSPFYDALVLPKLKNLITTNTDVSKIFLRNSAESVTLTGTALTILSALTNRDNIKQLHILDDKKNTYLVNFTDLKEFKHLKSFGYYNKNHKPNISPITGMIRLGIYGVNFSDIQELASNNPDLEELSISFSDQITNLDWAASFKNLRSLSIGGLSDSSSIDSLNVSALIRLKQLAFFAIDLDDFNRNSTQFKKLAKACPTCDIYLWKLYPALCLGSGWLLLYLPVLLVIVAIKKKMKGKST